MDIENQIFKRFKVDFNKLNEYGFVYLNTSYIYEKSFLNNKFKAIITINNKGILKGKIIDLNINEEYINIRTNINGNFNNKVKENYTNILIDIRDKCFITNTYINDQTNRVNTYINNKYNNNPEFLWPKYPGFGIYRNSTNKKWYAIIMNINLSKISNINKETEIINIKLDESKIFELLKRKGFYKAYHMNKKSWISIELDNIVKDEELFNLIDESYNKVI